MKALTLTPPWCWCIPPKLIETRGRYTTHRGPLLIHVGKNLKPVGGWVGLAELCQAEPFRSLLQPLLPRHAVIGREALEALPMGQIVSVCDLIACMRTEILTSPEYHQYDCHDFTHPLTEIERALGDYRPGRFGLLLGNISPVVPRIPWRGTQGFFEVPDAALPAWVQARSQ